VPEERAADAIAQINGTTLGGRNLIVSEARPRQESFGGGRAGAGGGYRGGPGGGGGYRGGPGGGGGRGGRGSGGGRGGRGNGGRRGDRDRY
jgi:cold-inducible RNA-binding protein